MAKPPDVYEYIGVIHIHTTDSDGSRTHDEIIKMAHKYGLDYLMFADHMTLDNKSKEGWYDKTLVIIGYEHNYDVKDSNHYLIFGLNRTLPGDLKPEMYVKRVRQAGGLGVIAHPDEDRELDKYPPLPWTDWSVSEFDGIEIWNHMSAWLEGLAKGSKIKYLLNPRSLLQAPPKKTLERWDRINLHRNCVGIGSADAHGHRVKLLGIFWKTIFPYEVELCSIRTHVITKQPLPRGFAPAHDEFIHSLKACRAFVSNYRWGDARGFRFWAETPRYYALIGDRITYHPKLKFFVRSPYSAKVILIRNGEKIAEDEGTKVVFNTRGLGCYRVELWRDGKGWIFSNHIHVEKQDAYKSQDSYRTERRNHHGSEKNPRSRSDTRAKKYSRTNKDTGIKNTQNRRNRNLPSKKG